MTIGKNGSSAYLHQHLLFIDMRPRNPTEWTTSFWEPSDKIGDTYTLLVDADYFMKSWFRALHHEVRIVSADIWTGVSGYE